MSFPIKCGGQGNLVWMSKPPIIQNLSGLVCQIECYLHILEKDNYF